jgi:hypothetical protein
LIDSIATLNALFAGVSLVLVTALFASPRAWLTSRAELATSFGLVWLCSLLPIFWAYPSPPVFADQLWSTLFVLLASAAFPAAALVRKVVSRGQSDIDDQQAAYRRGIG